ncbi:hypothetical protein [Vreelandella alkaliphila]|uniref:hypothetical protein n=1 Tax=Vreelandella alkaliphila TaxID=272774 RepID=UPI003F965E9F
MIDAILHLPNATQIPEPLADEDGNLALGDPQTVNGEGDRLHYVRMLPAQLDEWRSHATVLAEATYTGTGTAARVYQQIQDDPGKLAIYESVYDTAPREVGDGEGGTMTITPPFAFGMLAESKLPVPASVSARQGMEQLIRLGLDEQVDTAIDEIEDPIQRKIVRNWFEKAGEWERDNPQFVALSEKLGLSAEQSDDYMRQAATL